MKKIALSILLALALLTTLPAFAQKKVNEPWSKRVILLIVNGISSEDLLKDDLPNIKKSLNQKAAIGLMNTRAAKGAGSNASSYLSIGVGARADAGSLGNLAVDKNETILLHGMPQAMRQPRQGNIITPGYPEMARLAVKLGYAATPGTLGELLRQADIKRSVFGNADTLGKYHREINLISMDTYGETDFGTVAKTINSPSQALSAISSGLEKSQFVALDYGPTSIISSKRDFLTDKTAAAQKRRRLREVDEIFGKLLTGYLDDKTMIMMITPYPAIELAKSGSFQTPVIIAASGWRGLLTSSSTRWQGMVTNSDIAPTILSFLDIPSPQYLRGRPIFSTKTPDPLTVVNEMEKKALINYSARSSLLSSYLTFSVFAIVLSALVLLLWPKANGLLYLQPLLLSLLFMPVVMLVTNFFSYPEQWFPVLIIPVASVTLGLLTWRGWRRRPTLAIATPCILSALVLLVQLPLGSWLERNSLMGMSSIVGARFYGIGNEYAAVLLAVSTICLTIWFSFKPALSKISTIAITSIIFLILTFVIGLPFLGANIGGALATVTVGIVLVLLLQKISLKVKHLIYIAIGMGLAIGAILLVDYLSANFSHAARAVVLIRGGGSGQALKIISRKLSTNIRLINHSSWTEILLAAIFAGIALKLGASHLLKTVVSNYNFLLLGFKSIILGGITALLLNDSGVVAAAIMVLYAVCGWLYLVIDLSQTSSLVEP